jgi:two-component system chemotaxis response regulator CheY
MSKHALIVDDCTFTTKYLSRCLSDLGYIVTSSASGEAAIERLRAGLEIDVILIDWVMPGMSGTELLSWLRSQPQFAGTPTVMVTAQGELEHIVEALQKGADEYIIKPFTREAVAEKLRLAGAPIQDTKG